MALTSYITNAELLLHFPNASEYSSDQITEALTTSFSMVNSFLSAIINLPAIGSSGEIPGLLRIGQVRFAQYILESSNQGWTQELQNLHNHTAEYLSKLTNNEVLISEITNTQKDVGWVVQSTTASSGHIFTRGASPTVFTELTFTVTSTGTNYVFNGAVTFDVKRRDRSATYTEIVANYDWKFPISTENIEIRFDGQFTEDEVFTIKGTPKTVSLSSTNQVIQQSTLLY